MELTTLCYIETEDAYLMMHRIKKKADVNNNNSNYQWYSYEASGDKKGMWANAVTVKDTNRQTYLMQRQELLYQWMT